MIGTPTGVCLPGRVGSVTLGHGTPTVEMASHSRSLVGQKGETSTSGTGPSAQPSRNRRAAVAVVAYPRRRLSLRWTDTAHMVAVVSDAKSDKPPIDMGRHSPFTPSHHPHDSPKSQKEGLGARGSLRLRSGQAGLGRAAVPPRDLREARLHAKA